MIIKCEKCQTKFRLDDSKVTDRGVKVRCTKCKQVFMVHKEEPEELQNQPETALTDFTSPVNIPMPSPPSEDTSFSDNSSSAISFESDKSANLSGDIPFTPDDGVPDEVDFSSFDFGDIDSERDSAPQTTLSDDDFTSDAALSVAETPPKESLQGLDFSDDDMFGVVVQSEPESSKETISFDFEGDSFAESMDVGGQDASSKGDSAYSLDVPGDAPFNLGEIDFGDELTSVAVQQVNPEDLKPSQEILFAPLAAAQEKTADDELARSFLNEEPATNQQDLPPLSITSRRKQSPLFVGAIAVVLLSLVAVLGYFGFSSISTPKDAPVTADIGKIVTRSVTAAYIANEEAGELLVISGEALNEYPTPRSALQVSVTVFDAKGQSVATKSAYCGNPLSEKQLVSMPIDEIDAAMANQFGDSLANMEVAPGKSIPFVVVVANLSKGAKDFSVQSAGSTLATGKQQ